MSDASGHEWEEEGRVGGLTAWKCARCASHAFSSRDPSPELRIEPRGLSCDEALAEAVLKS